MAKTTRKTRRDKSSANPPLIEQCGIVMPISDVPAVPECTRKHWTEVLSIIKEALVGKFLTEVVSNGDDTRVIQSRILQNLYKVPIAVCDVSCKNANVMFELGIRIAFDRPVVVIKDDITDFSFDSSPLEHLIYPRSLNYQDICLFKKHLREKVQKTYESSKRPDYESFLKVFAPNVVAGKLNPKFVSETELLASKIDQLSNDIASLSGRARESHRVLNVAYETEECLFPGCSRAVIPTADCCYEHFIKAGGVLSDKDKDLLRKVVNSSLELMSYREREIIKLRFGLEVTGYSYTLEEVGHIFKLDRAAVRKIETKAMSYFPWLTPELTRVLFPAMDL